MMIPLALEPVAASALAEFAVAFHQAEALGNHGGFSGTRLWRVASPAGVHCLRCWPPDTAEQDVDTIHRLMGLARQADLPFVPLVYRTPAGRSWTQRQGLLWELTEWLPGRADYHERPNHARLKALITAVARLHAAWSNELPTQGPSPAVRRRWERLLEWHPRIAASWAPPTPDDDELAEWVLRGWAVFRRHFARLPDLLRPWLDRHLPLQPCLGDIWHDHLLFEDDRLVGLIDYGGLRWDNVAADLARLLGSTVANDAALRQTAVQLYGRMRPLGLAEEALIGVLDETGTLLAIGNWLKWLCCERRVFEDRGSVRRRLAFLVERVEKW